MASPPTFSHEPGTGLAQSSSRAQGRRHRFDAPVSTQNSHEVHWGEAVQTFPVVDPTAVVEARLEH